MPIVQISRIQHRRGKATDLPQLAAGELGWVIDDQKLYIGNGTVADGAPAVGNTEIITAGSTGFASALQYIYKGYRQDDTILTGANVNSPTTRSLQERLDDIVSIKSFGAKGDDSSANATTTRQAIQRALDEIYSDTVDQGNSQSRRILLFPAGTYRIDSTLKIPPFAQLVGEGNGKTIIYNTGTGPVAKTVDQDGVEFGSMTGVPTTPKNISFEGITFKTGVAYGGVSLDCVENVSFYDCGFEGTYASGGADITTVIDSTVGKGVTVRSTTALSSSNITFDKCTFTKFARLVQLDHDVVSVKFNNSDFSLARYGAVIGTLGDGSTSGQQTGPKNIQFLSNQFKNIHESGIKVSNSPGGVKNIVSFNNFFDKTVGLANSGNVDNITKFPIVDFNADECSSVLDFFDISGRRSNTQVPLDQVQGVCNVTSPIKITTLKNNQSLASSGIMIPAVEDKKIIVDYKIKRGSNYRVGKLTINAYTTGVTYNDEFEENDDLQIDLIPSWDDLDSSGSSESVVVRYNTDNSVDATLNYQITVGV